MLLNPSHKLTSSGLPPDLQDAYVRYKRSTRGVLTWFQQNSTAPHNSFRSMTINGLESLVENVSDKIEILPEIIHYYFKEAIADRKQLSKYYRAQVGDATDDPATAGHEHFTARLEKIYDGLCARFGHQEPAKQKNPKRRALSSQVGRPNNHYRGLTVEEAKDNDHSDTDVAVQESLMISSALKTVPHLEENQTCEVYLADDNLGTALEVMVAVQQLQHISSSIDGYWAAAGHGTISFVVAAFITNVAFASLQQVINNLLQHQESLSVPELVSICHSFRGSFETELRNQKIIGTNGSLLTRLLNIDDASEQAQEEAREFSQGSPCPHCAQKFANEVHSDVMEKTVGSRFISIALAANVANSLSSEAMHKNSIMSTTPVYADMVKEVSAGIKHEKESWFTVLSLNLLTQSYRSYLRLIKQPNMIPKCRIAALKLAQQVDSQVSKVLQDKECFPCRCAETLGYHLQSMAFDMQCYARHNCWDLVFQSPWVAGNHVLEILDICQHYGSCLLKYRHYIGAIMHSYNALTKVGGLDNIPILEELCRMFGGTLFPGGHLPKSNFHACWARYVGARLKFNKDHNGKNTHDNWCLAVPRHAARSAAGIGISGHSQSDNGGCLLFAIKKQGYNLTDGQWDEINESWATLLRNGKSKKSDDATSKMPPSKAEASKLLPLVVAARAMLSGRSGDTLPVTRVNLFAVFEKCVRAVSILSEQIHKGENRGDERYCVCFATGLLDAADRLVKGRRLGKLEAFKKRERQIVNDMKDTIVEVFGSVQEHELLWDV